MKDVINDLLEIPRVLWDAAFFTFAVFFGSIYKMIKQKEQGMQITFRKFLAELFVSFFIAGISFAIFDQFLHFNKLFTFAMCSFAGSQSSKLHKQTESLIDWAFDVAKKKIE